LVDAAEVQRELRCTRTAARHVPSVTRSVCPANVRADGERTPQEFLKSRQRQEYPAFSPDGRWIAYALDDGVGGPAEIWVRPYPGPEPAVRVSTEGGTMPRWSLDGNRIFFVGGDGGVMAADVAPKTAFKSSTPRRLTGRLEGVRSFAVALTARRSTPSSTRSRG
jgi:hypothetical protein